MSYRANTVLVWCLNLSSISGFILWALIPMIQLRFRKAYIYQGRDLNELPYKATFYPYSAYFGITVPIIIVLSQGYVSFYPEWNTVKFVGCYIGILPFVLSYTIHKLVTKSKLVPLEDMGRFYTLYFHLVAVHLLISFH
jgi:lysine-specific permease